MRGAGFGSEAVGDGDYLSTLCHLSTGLILRSLEMPVEATSIPEAVVGLRRWSRWRRRATDLGVSEPDPFLASERPQQNRSETIGDESGFEL